MQGDHMPNIPALQDRMVAPQSMLAAAVPEASAANSPSYVSQAWPQVSSLNLPPPPAEGVSVPYQRQLETDMDRAIGHGRQPSSFSGSRTQHASTGPVGAGVSSTPSAQIRPQIDRLHSTANLIQAQVYALMRGVDSVQQEMANVLRSNQCCICLTATRDSQLLPCMHDKFCKACLELHLSRSNQCPMCRGAVRGMLTSFG